ncbi:putative ubiquitin-conjugating enzyme protein [Botrytis fragariae]|uniref:Putative ubiquitin-conjugating enzyme protein n=1 Tax=Botrytis fragariae TaxID=1964551 RepID=A0A8H6B1E9_9HELO|nr:putative ubiquitin-conjugating enzyme protein [Botrytis fragariae]KAF5877355.1 putative ubiquitin-conjugating enzyme protein [Botrytis fragariae]
MAPGFNTKSPTLKRIMKEAAELSQHPSPDYTASPASDTDLFDWHFTLRGPPSSSFAEGIYHGRIVLPPQYPLRPPSFRFLTPSGRFEVNREICLSISGHHEETWQPAWGIRTALVALRSFMETSPSGQLGGVDASDSIRKRIAGESRGWKCGVCGGRSCEEILGEAEQLAKELESEGTGSNREEETVPPDMQIGLKKETKAETGSSQEMGSNQEIDEGNSKSTEEVKPAQAESEYPPARPAQTVSQPTATIPLPQNPQPRRQMAQARVQSDEGVPVWVDRAIAGIVLCLVVMVLKMLLGK